MQDEARFHPHDVWIESLLGPESGPDSSPAAPERRMGERARCACTIEHAVTVNDVVEGADQRRWIFIFGLGAKPAPRSAFCAICWSSGRAPFCRKGASMFGSSFASLRIACSDRPRFFVAR